MPHQKLETPKQSFERTSRNFFGKIFVGGGWVSFQILSAHLISSSEASILQMIIN